MNWTVADVMTREPVTVAPATPFKSCANLLRIHELSAIPVVGADGTLVGLVSEADLLAKEISTSTTGRRPLPDRKAMAFTVDDLMTPDLVMTTPDAPLTTAASLMFEHHLKVLPVVDASNRLVGVVSRAQVLRVFLRSDESIRREVARELRLVPEVIRGRVDADVKDGVVHLHIEADRESTTEQLKSHVAPIPGVVGVVTHISPREAACAAAVDRNV